MRFALSRCGDACKSDRSIGRNSRVRCASAGRARVAGGPLVGRRCLVDRRAASRVEQVVLRTGPAVGQVPLAAEYVPDHACGLATELAGRTEEHTSELQSLMRIP